MRAGAGELGFQVQAIQPQCLHPALRRALSPYRAEDEALGPGREAPVSIRGHQRAQGCQLCTLEGVLSHRGCDPSSAVPRAGAPKDRREGTPGASAPNLLPHQGLLEGPRSLSRFQQWTSWWVPLQRGL